MTQPTLPQPPRDVAEPRRAHGWWALVLTVLIFGTLLFLVGAFWMLSIGEAVHYGHGSGGDAHLRFGEALSGVGFGAVLVLLALAGATLISVQTCRAFGIRHSAGVVFVVGLLAAEVTCFLAAPFVLEAQGVYQG